jgi:hypothetical protein
MGLFIFAIILAVIAIGVLLGLIFAMPKTSTYRGTTSRNWGRTWGIIGTATAAIILVPLMIFLSGWNTVPVKSVGVTTSFGKVGAEYGSGAHWLFPTQTLNIIQDTIQTDRYFQSNGTASTLYSANGAVGGCITVRLGGNQEGCADVQLQTQVEPSAIPELFANYSSYGSDLTADIDQYVVYRELVTVLNHQLGDYNPVADVSATLASNGTASQFSSFDPALLSAMQSDLAGQVKVLNFNLQYVHYDPATQNRINQIATQYADTQVAIQQEQTNKAISAANAALVQSNSLSAAVLQNECYTTTQDAIKAGYSLPTGWNCSGVSSGVILPGK